jgi:hypothetical protein
MSPGVRFEGEGVALADLHLSQATSRGAVLVALSERTGIGPGVAEALVAESRGSDLTSCSTLTATGEFVVVGTNVSTLMIVGGAAEGAREGALPMVGVGEEAMLSSLTSKVVVMWNGCLLCFTELADW